MEGSEFQKYFNHYPHLKKYFVGTFAIDTLPKSLKQNHFLIFNSDTSDKKGQHWLALYKEKIIIYCFDSIGIDNNKKLLLEQYCKIKNVEEIHFNETQFQLLTTDTCGKFVIYFLIQKAYNKDLTFNELLEDIFKASPNQNELLISKFFERAFKDLNQ